MLHKTMHKLYKINIYDLNLYFHKISILKYMIWNFKMPSFLNAKGVCSLIYV